PTFIPPAGGFPPFPARRPGSQSPRRRRGHSSNRPLGHQSHHPANAHIRQSQTNCTPGHQPLECVKPVSTQTNSPHDAVIVTALPLEYLAVRSYLTDITESTHHDTVYETGTFTTSTVT